MELIPWKIASLAVAKERRDTRPVVYVENESGKRVGLMREDLQKERWRLPQNILLKIGVIEGVQLAMAAAPSDVKDVIFRALLSEVSGWDLTDVSFVSLIEDMPFTLSVVTPKGEILMVSRQDFPGAPLEEAIGTNMCDWLPSERHDIVLSRYQESANSGVWFEDNDTIITPEGAWGTRAWCGPSQSGNVVVINMPPQLILPGNVRSEPQLAVAH